jgi:hypothetical protein
MNTFNARAAQSRAGALGDHRPSLPKGGEYHRSTVLAAQDRARRFRRVQWGFAAAELLLVLLVVLMGVVWLMATPEAWQ